MSRRISLMALALVVALIGTAAVFSYAKKADARAVEGQQTLSVLVAKSMLPVGTKAADANTKGMLKLDQIPKKYVPDGALTNIKDVQNLVVGSDIQAGQILLRSMFVTTADTSVLSIPGDKMAVSVQLEDPARVAGFVVPGSEVAIFDTFDSASADATVTQTGPTSATAQVTADKKQTRILLPRVKVIAVGATALVKKQAATDNQDKVPTAILTLAVSQQEAEKLVHAVETGTLYFALLTERSKTAPAPGVDNRTLFQ